MSLSLHLPDLRRAHSGTDSGDLGFPLEQSVGGPPPRIYESALTLFQLSFGAGGGLTKVGPGSRCPKALTGSEIPSDNSSLEFRW